MRDTRDMRDMMDEFVKYAKEEFGYDITFEKSLEPDTFETLFGASFLKQKEDEKFFCEGNENCMSYSNSETKIRIDSKMSESFSSKSELAFAA